MVIIALQTITSRVVARLSAFIIKGWTIGRSVMEDQFSCTQRELEIIDPEETQPRGIGIKEKWTLIGGPHGVPEGKLAGIRVIGFDFYTDISTETEIDTFINKLLPLLHPSIAGLVY